MIDDLTAAYEREFEPGGFDPYDTTPDSWRRSRDDYERHLSKRLRIKAWVAGLSFLGAGLIAGGAVLVWGIEG
jgi:hypothetical protein